MRKPSRVDFTKDALCAPFGKINAGDVVFMKESGGLVRGAFRVYEVEYFELDWVKVREIETYCHQQIFASKAPKCPRDGFGGLTAKWYDSKYATLIHIADPVAFREPFAFPKRDQRAWVVLEDISDVKLQHIASELILGSQLMHGYWSC